MKKFFSDRFVVVGVAYALLFVILIVGLFDLQFRQGDDYAEESTQDLERDLRITGNRGTIMDANGIPLAYDQNSFQVVFYKDSSLSLNGRTEDETDDETRTNGDMYTEVIRKTISIVEENGGEALSSFAIRHDKDGNPEFDFSTENEDIEQVRLERWLSNMYIPSKYYGDEDEFYDFFKDPELSGEVYSEYDIYEGITDDELKSMLAAEVYDYLRGRYKIPDDVSYEEAFKILSVWQEVQLSSYRSYTPVLISDDVNMDTVAEIEMRKMQLTGMEIQESNVRVYPKNEVAAHIVGYMGRMLDEDTIMENIDLGYSRDDLIGISGIEATMEGELTANLASRTGTRTVEVNSKGKIVAEKSVTAATDGNDVILTIDLKMQKKLEEILEENINLAYSAQQERYANYIEDYEKKMTVLGRTSEIQMAEVGAAVIMNVQSGAILAMASYPSFDPNIFTGGLSEAEYDVIKSDLRNPLFNKAIASRAAPGSIFKMVTAVGGLMDGVIDIDTQIIDKGEEGPWTATIDEDYTGSLPSCWVGPKYYTHLNEGVAEALKNSCNYYFFTVAFGLGIDRLNEWADLLGLTSKTNVELLGETAGQVANENTLYDPTKDPTGTSLVVYNAIRRTIKAKCDELELEIEDEVYDNVTLELMTLAKDDEPGPDIRGILKNEIGLSTYDIMNVPYQRLDLAIAQYLYDLKWSPIETVLTGIGQSVTLLTPIAVCRYVAALVNGGNIYEARLVQSIVSPDGQIIEEKRPQLIRTLNISQEYTDAIKEGMAEVTRLEDGGTAGKYFVDFRYPGEIGGKTGTAQVSQIDLENNAWFVAFTPFDNPEIAIAVYIKNGYTGGLAAYTAKEMVEFYLDRKLQEVTPDEVPGSNDLTP